MNKDDFRGFLKERKIDVINLIAQLDEEHDELAHKIQENENTMSSAHEELLHIRYLLGEVSSREDDE